MASAMTSYVPHRTVGGTTFSRSGLASKLDAEPLSVTAFGSSGLGERVRRLQEMLAERQSSSSNQYTSMARSRVADRSQNASTANTPRSKTPALLSGLCARPSLFEQKINGNGGGAGGGGGGGGGGGCTASISSSVNSGNNNKFGSVLFDGTIGRSANGELSRFISTPHGNGTAITTPTATSATKRTNYATATTTLLALEKNWPPALSVPRVTPIFRTATAPKPTTVIRLETEATDGLKETLCPDEKEVEKEKEKKRSPRKYLGSLTSTKYFHNIFSPIRGDSNASNAKELLRRSESVKQGPRKEELSNSNVCAIVVPSDSTMENPVIKRRSWLKSSPKAEKKADAEMVKEAGGDHSLLIHDTRDVPLQQSSPHVKRPSAAEKSDGDQYALIRRKSKRLSFMGEDKAFKIPFLSVSTANHARPKSTSFVAAEIDCLNIGKELSSGNSENVTPSLSDKHSANEKLLKDRGAMHNGLETSCNGLSNDVVKNAGLLSKKEYLKNGSLLTDENLQNLQSSNISTRRPLLTVTTDEDLMPVDIASTVIANSKVAQFGSLSPSGRHLRDLRRPLPPLLEVQGGPDGTEGGVLTGDEQSTVSYDLPKRSPKKYVHSHTTSTYNGAKDAAPDASPRRHLIGFLHRTSHLSLTSELSADASFYLIGHRGGRRFEDSTIGSESDARLFSDDDDRSRVSTSTDITSVSRQHQSTSYRKRRNRRRYRQPSRASSFSSITESSMSLDVIKVTLNMDTVNFLGISIVGQSSSRGDNGIYVANIMKGGAVALDGRIEPGDMILQVNDISLENFTNDQAVDVLRESVARRGSIKLTVAKMWDGGPRSAFTVPRHRDEPVRPIDTQAWVQHTNAMRGMPSILEGSEGAPTPIPGQYGRPPSSSTVTSTGSAQNTIIGGAHVRLDTMTEKKRVVQMMVMPNSGLDIKNRTWLKIPIPMSFLGKDLVDWLMEHVDGLRDRKDGRKFAGELLKEKLISHVVNKITFTEQCYYVLGEECADFARLRQNPAPDEQMALRSEVGSVLPPPPTGFVSVPAQQNRAWQQPALMPQGAPSMASGYACMPISPYPPPSGPYVTSGVVHGGNPAGLCKGGVAPDVHSQTSSNDGSSGSEHRRTGRPAVLPPAPTTVRGHLPVGSSASMAVGPSAAAALHANRLDELPQDLVSSRQSFRIAMSQPYEFFVDNL